ncbi:hypothetical protein AVEN_145718-1 [Araneus ventricosus]|uniref:Secreted protein n=1 Tax=Araneus ventricosus TaxID=182803 RepID=A0A4Y2PN10_ARAVE|nr:hypothetical protein AVEN_80626-1 [Araneus ventricosus]GBN52744.1 hypothetical protein AVEN_145718-1 [Araneus ventricosus]
MRSSWINKGGFASFVRIVIVWYSVTSTPVTGRTSFENICAVVGDGFKDSDLSFPLLMWRLFFTSPRILSQDDDNSTRDYITAIIMRLRHHVNYYCIV